MDQETVEMKITLAVLVNKVDSLASSVDRQEKVIEELVALANKGKGSAWVLMGIGGFIGMVLSNIKTFISLVVR